jgi:hypothetical protein
MPRSAILLLSLIALCSTGLLFAYHPPLQTDYSVIPQLEQPERADSAHGFDVYKYEITLTINDATHFISGNVKAYVTAEEALTGLDYELVGLTVSEVRVNNSTASFTHQNGILHIVCYPSAGQSFTTQIFYSGTPALSPAPYNIGMIFNANTVFTISDPDASRYWWPCYDHPWDKAIVDLHVTMRSDWLVACNGIRDSIVDNGDGTKTHNWLGSNPMAPYLACITAAPYLEINQTAGSIPIQNFVTQSQYNNAVIDFATLPEILQYFETQFGPYPFEKYGNAVMNITTYGAMEHQTMTTLGAGYITGTHSGENVIAHELAHSWYGNCLTPLTFKDVWLSEGFGTYSEFIWLHHRDGWDVACDYMNDDVHNYYISFEDGNSGLENIIYNPPFYAYFYPQSYQKASSVLHMLRFKIGNTAFFQLLQNWFTTYHNGNIITSEFQDMAEQISGQDLDQFFRQWIYSNGIPYVEYIPMFNPATSQGKIIGQTICSTGTEFVLDIPFTATGLAGGDSLVFVAGPVMGDPVNTFPLATGQTNYSIDSIDPNHWLLCREFIPKDVTLTECMPSNHGVYIRWEQFSLLSDLVGYHVFRRSENEITFSQLTQTPLSQTDYFDSNEENGTEYFYLVKAVDSTGFMTLGSNIMSATPVEFTFVSGLLVVDETRDGNGSVITPNDAMVDDFYAAALTPLPFDTWDYATQGPPPLSVLGQYHMVLWHADDYSQNLLGNNLNLIGGYLWGDGKVIISGWKTPLTLTPGFIDTFMRNTDLIYDNNAVLISAESEDYPQLLVDPAKLLPTWNGRLPMIYTFAAEEIIVYTATMSEGAAGDGFQIGTRYDTPGTLVFLGLPLYFMQLDGVRGFLQQILPELYPSLATEDNTGVTVPLTMTCYPNPFKGSLNISFEGKSSPAGNLQVYNVKGQKVTELDLARDFGDDSPVSWEAVDSRNQSLPGGIYLLRYSDCNSTVLKKVVLLK